MSPLDDVARQLRQRGVVITAVPGGFCINYRHGQPATAMQTEDLQEALRLGLAWPPPPATLPPLGPMGREDSRRARMYAHNRRIAGRRHAAAGAESDT